MNPEERIVTWLISLGVLDSPKKKICDPEEFLKSSLKNGVVLCRLINRLVPGSVEKYCLEPQIEADCINNINDFLKGCATLQVEVLQNILDTEKEYAKELQNLLVTYLRPLQSHNNDDLEKFMENQGASSPGILILTTSLSKPFMRLEKYVTLLQELERHMEDTHPDHQDILKAIIAFKTLMGQCQDLRKRKQLELQILSEPIQAWEGEDIKTLGNVIFMSQVMVQYGTCEEKEERYLMLFTNVLIMLSASPRMSGFIYQVSRFHVKQVARSIIKNRLDEIEGNECTFEITGTAALEEDAQILKVIEAYCTSANFQQGHGSTTRKDSVPQVLLPEEEKLIIEETRSNGQTIIEEKSLVDTVYALKDEVKELKQENKRMKQCLEEELKSRRDLEKLVRRLLKQTDECIRAESSSKTSILP
ncbi:Rho guanine nucleotide exchange factor 6 [Tupaia chinensis]|uniref:Rho guanine nucleotide exchange factor 6 n=1 Tax=Tupaia chinensis TaxID=246437 RepID=L9J8N1_TUPCH|nr:Rho guanine nucleotide exchange factor 6 [Tupaia chinensis]